MFLRKDIPLNIYQLGDLDDFFWPYTQWYGLQQNGEIIAVVLLYTEVEPPVVVALAKKEKLQPLKKLVLSIRDQLPHHFYAHLSEGLQTSLANMYQLTFHSIHYKMILKDRWALRKANTTDVQRLTTNDLEDLKKFYNRSYPSSWFNPRMLETGHYHALYQSGEMVCAGGIHVYSPLYKVAALGNIATHPDYRNRGYAKQVIAALCSNLLKVVDHIGLNVSVDNATALKCYTQLGFGIIDNYEEFTVKKV
ncbi:MAG: GNAT family N-acetyltransferase [Fidelibacterota bacterium]